MNINIDNYEAYLMDYIDGQLSSEESRQLKQFIAQQGLDFDELVQDLPTLEPQPIIYEQKENLKKKSVVIPLFAKIAAAAAVVVLLFGLFMNRHETSPNEQPMAESSPNIVQPLEDKVETPNMERNESIQIQEVPEVTTKQRKANSNKTKPVEMKPIEVEHNHDIQPLLASLEPIQAHEIQFSDDYLVENGLLPQMPIYPIYFEENIATNDFGRFEGNPSWLEQGFLWVSNGKCNNLGQLIHLGLHRASHDVIHYTAKAALTAYYTIDFRIEEAKERFKENNDEP